MAPLTWSVSLLHHGIGLRADPPRPLGSTRGEHGATRRDVRRRHGLSSRPVQRRPPGRPSPREGATLPKERVRTRRRGPRPALPDRHRAVPAAHQGRRGPPRPGRSRAATPRASELDAAARSSPRPRSASCAAASAQGEDAAAHVRAVEPAARRVDRQEVPGVGPAAARPHPGGQPRPDARRREVRLAQGLQVLDVRHVVDPPGDHPRHRQHRPHDPAARARRRHARPAAEGPRRASSSSSAARRRSSELAAEVEMPEDKVTEALRFAAEPLSLSEPLREDGDAELGDIVEDRSAESPFEVAATALLPGRDREAARPARRARARRSSRCASVSTAASRARSKRSASTSTSPGSASARSRPGRCRSCATRRADTGARDLLAV